ncbi:hypothetical protein Goklo_003014, partial [Gossypium klotzschianum]|nr:hypothetical protein [Gossypium klotzschianum]
MGPGGKGFDLKHGGRWKIHLRGRKRELTRKLDEIMDKERNDENLVNFIDTKIQLNLNIGKDKAFWEQRVHASWLGLGDRNIFFFRNFSSHRRRMSIIKCLEHRDGRGVKDEGQMEDDSVERALAKSCKTVKCAPPTRSVIKINFDAAFDNHQSRSGSGIVTRNTMGEVLVSRSILHDDIGFMFAAKALGFSWAAQMGVEM